MPLMLALAYLVVLLDASQVFADCVLVFTEKALMEYQGCEAADGQANV